MWSYSSPPPPPFFCVQFVATLILLTLPLPSTFLFCTTCYSCIFFYVIYCNFSFSLPFLYIFQFPSSFLTFYFYSSFLPLLFLLSSSSLKCIWQNIMLFLKSRETISKSIAEGIRKDRLSTFILVVSCMAYSNCTITPTSPLIPLPFNSYDTNMLYRVINWYFLGVFLWNVYLCLVL